MITTPENHIQLICHTAIKMLERSNITAKHVRIRCPQMMCDPDLQEGKEITFDVFDTTRRAERLKFKISKTVTNVEYIVYMLNNNPSSLSVKENILYASDNEIIPVLHGLINTLKPETLEISAKACKPKRAA